MAQHIFFPSVAAFLFGRHPCILLSSGKAFSNAYVFKSDSCSLLKDRLQHLCELEVKTALQLGVAGCWGQEEGHSPQCKLPSLPAMGNECTYIHDMRNSQCTFSGSHG